VHLEFIELDLDWPSDLNIFHLRGYILSKLMDHGEPLRWAITSLTTCCDNKIQQISIEAVLIIKDAKRKDFNTNLN
tara:strand:- start:293 stop:520 length:228 start_codon:yes stop_codon:yes gene_type:complete